MNVVRWGNIPVADHQYKEGQLRTLQRRVKEWRSEAILTFDYEWINDELFVKDNFITEFQGKLIREARRTGKIIVVEHFT